MCVYRTFSELGLLIFIGMNTLIIWCSYSIQYVGRKRFLSFSGYLFRVCVTVWGEEDGRRLNAIWQVPSAYANLTGSLSLPILIFNLYRVSCYVPFHRIVEEILSLSLVDKSICVGGTEWTFWQRVHPHIGCCEIYDYASSVSFLITIKTINVFVLRPLLAGHIRATTWISFCISSSPFKRPNI
jgi:hypothetical protein